MSEPHEAAAAAKNSDAAAGKIQIALSKQLSERIAEEYRLMQQHITRLQEQTDKQVRTLLEGYLAAHPQAEGRNFNLSSDRTFLIEQ